MQPLEQRDGVDREQGIGENPHDDVRDMRETHQQLLAAQLKSSYLFFVSFIRLQGRGYQNAYL